MPSKICLFILPDQHLHIGNNVCINTHNWLQSDCTWITVTIKYYCKWNIFTKTGRGAKCRLYIHHWGAGPEVDWANTLTLDKTFYNLLFKQEVVTPPSYFQIFFLIAVLKKFVRNAIITQRIVICINNNAIINNDCGRLQNFIFLLKITNGHAKKKIFQICRIFGHATSKRFASPDVYFRKYSRRNNENRELL